MKYTNREFIDITQNIALCRWQSDYLPIVEILVSIKYHQADKILDFGCGPAGPNRIFREIYNLNIDGVDISSEMIDAARKNDSQGVYKIVKKNGRIPFDDNSYIACYSSFVFVEIESITEIKHWLNEIYRILKNEGVLILTINNLSVVGNSNFAYSNMIKYGEEGKKYKIGERFEIILYGDSDKTPDIRFEDYYWPVDIFKSILKDTGFKNFEYKVQKNNNFIKSETQNLLNHGVKMIDTREIEGVVGIITIKK